MTLRDIHPPHGRLFDPDPIVRDVEPGRGGARESRRSTAVASRLRLAALTGGLLWCLPLLAGEPRRTEPAVLSEGRWTHRGARNIVGQGVDTTIVLEQEGAEWTIGYERILYPSVNQPGGKSVLERDGPFRVTVEDQEMVIARDGKTERYTFLCDPDRLILPAFVEKRPGEWSYRSGSESLAVRCEHDPIEVPVGRAQIPGVLVGRGFYSHEEAPRLGLWPRARYLRFLERSDEKGDLHEIFRLIFDEHGSPRYERLLSTGERSASDHEIRVFLAGPDGE